MTDTWLNAHAFYGFLSFTAFGIDSCPAFFCMMGLGFSNMLRCMMDRMDQLDWKDY